MTSRRGRLTPAICCLATDGQCVPVVSARDQVLSWYLAVNQPVLVLLHSLSWYFSVLGAYRRGQWPIWRAVAAAEDRVDRVLQSMIAAGWARERKLTTHVDKLI